SAGWVFRYRRITLCVTVILFLQGLFSWWVMPKEEDPRIRERYGIIVTRYPGATPEEVRRLIVIPVEEELAQIKELTELNTTIRSQVAITRVDLVDSVETEEAINEAWREVDDALERAKKKFPEGVLGPDLNRHLIDQTAI